MLVEVVFEGGPIDLAQEVMEGKREKTNEQKQDKGLCDATDNHKI